jgi:dolichol-phosphate mannosyltransferase
MSATNEVVSVDKIYRRRFSGDEERRIAIWKVLVHDFFQAWIPQNGVVLDLGCGYGEFLNHVRSARRIGVDLNPESSSCLDRAIEFHHGSICKLDFLPDASIDFAFTSNVMEHLPGKPEIERMLAEVHRVLKPEGCFVALGPNLRYATGRYWDFWDHQIPITDRSLAEVLELHNFSVTTRIPRFLPYTTKSWMPQSPLLVKLYLKCPIAWPIFGQQFLIRARKAASPAS